jgi:hypothetical protein
VNPRPAIEQGTRHRCPVASVGPYEELRACSRREGHGGDELRVVREAVLPVRSRPLPVEDVLAEAIRLEVEAERAEDAPSVFLADEVDRRPPAHVADAARAL